MLLTELEQFDPKREGWCAITDGYIKHFGWDSGQSELLLNELKVKGPLIVGPDNKPWIRADDACVYIAITQKLQKRLSASKES